MKQLQLLMGMPITVEVVDHSVTGADIEKVFAYFRAVDDTFSTYKEHSEISKINRGELGEEAYSDDMKLILVLSEQTKRETQGYFDIQHNGIADPSGIVKGWAILKAANMLKEVGFTNFYAAQIAGDFTLPQDPKQKLVFIAGGVGITPFRSMLKYLLDMKQPRDIVLLYANKTADEIAYQDILSEAQTKLGIKMLYTLTNTEAIPRNWRGLVGRIDEHMIQETIPGYEERTYYVSGPPAMVRV